MISLNINYRPEPAASVARPRAAHYEAAGSGRRVRSWRAPASGPNQIALEDAETLRNRSRDSIRQNANATAAVDSYTANAVGTGIKPQSLHPNAKKREKLHKQFRRWTDSADFDGKTDYYGLQALAWRATMESGECLVRFRTAPPSMGMEIPVQLELIEADHLPFYEKADGVPDGHIVVNGKEYDAAGRLVFYHLFTQHPNEQVHWRLGARRIERVPADQIIHLFHRTRPKQGRGLPWLAGVLVRLHKIEQYSDAELERKILCSSITGVITGQQGDSPIFNVEEGQVAGEPPTLDIQPGMIPSLAPGEGIEFLEPKDGSQFLDTFMRVELRAVAAGIGITYEQMSGDLEGVNYSSIRAGLLEFRRKCEQLVHSMFVFQFCRPVWNTWLRYAALNGVISSRDYINNRADYEDCRHVPPGWPWVDPVKDVTAAIKEIDAKLNSRSNVVAGRGEDVEEIDRQLAAEQARANELGLHNSKDPQEVEMAGKSSEESAPEDSDAPSGKRGRGGSSDD